ncbi:hypothetical protein OM076_24770 [Solirubrobacter ginsenosidimutans]|uniref:Uncharacterized protein n=1 Tax=Solirubrobacter ginsenosidimutans TaxID=490573 RepID=A0A9X3MVT8_9ACTN|nr:hypothetical protein [Solirubrobacter ginsenosidimutans]MDA0163510.1 hypothetical protein [Solirubrobacter ginsenosidimutans]
MSSPETDGLHAPPPPRPAPVVVAFGLKPERLVGAEGRIDAVPEPPTAEQAGLLIEALASGIKAGGAVIAIVPDWFAPEGLRRLEMARALLDTARVAIHVTSLPPLAATALASVASSLGPRLPSAGMLASALPGLSEQLHQITWLGSVTGLKHPAPSLGQHVTSLTPGSAFGVSSFPKPAVHKIQSGQPSVPLPALVRPSRLAVSARNGDEQWITGPVNAALGNLPVVRVEPTPGGPEYWGTSKLVEAIVVPADPDGLARELLQSVEAWACRWCGELIARSPCPLCGHRARPRRRPAPPQQGARK